MNEVFEKDVAVDGSVANEGERSSSTVSKGRGPLVGLLERGQRWRVRRKQEAVLRLLRGEPVELLSRELGVEVYRLEAWREKAMSGMDKSLKERKGDPLHAELDTAMKRVGELSMQVEFLETKMGKSVPLARRMSRR